MSSSLPAGLSAEGWQAGQTGFSFFYSYLLFFIGTHEYFVFPVAEKTKQSRGLVEATAAQIRRGRTRNQPCLAKRKDSYFVFTLTLH